MTPGHRLNAEDLMSIVEIPDAELLQRHLAAEAESTTFAYAKPAGVNAGKSFVHLGRKDIVRGPCRS